MSTDSDAGSVTPHGAGAVAKRSLRQWFVTGAALTIPLIITLIVLGFVLNFVNNALAPVVMVVRFAGLEGPIDSLGHTLGVGSSLSAVLIEIITVVALLAIIFVVGIVAESRLTEGRASETFHTVIEGIPGIGSVYRSFRRMGDVLVESDTDSFQEVKLVEYPNDGVYSIAFLTAETTGAVTATLGHDEMQTLFVPMAPNPVMGGFVVYVATDRIYDTDMTVEEGIRSIVTSGVATGMDDTQTAVSAERMEALGFDGQPVPGPDPNPTENSDVTTKETDTSTPETNASTSKTDENTPKTDGATSPDDRV